MAADESLHGLPLSVRAAMGLPVIPVWILLALWIRYCIWPILRDSGPIYSVK